MPDAPGRRGPAPLPPSGKLACNGCCRLAQRGAGIGLSVYRHFCTAAHGKEIGHGSPFQNAVVATPGWCPERKGAERG